MLTNQDKIKIIDTSVTEIHKDIRGEIKKVNKQNGFNEDRGLIVEYNNINSNINLDWKHKKIDYPNLLVLFIVLIVNIYLIIKSSLICILLSNISSISILYVLYLDGSLSITIDHLFKERLDNRYKIFLNKIIPKYLDVLSEKINKNNCIEELLNTNLSESFDKKDLLISPEINFTKLIIYRLVANILELNPDIINIKVDVDNADIIINKTLKCEEPDIVIKKKGVVVDCKIDNGTYCIGSLEDNSIIVEIEVLNDGNIKIIDSKGLKIFVDN